MSEQISQCAHILQAPLIQRIVHVESGGNPFAIGVVGGQLVRQPRTLAEAVVTAQSLEQAGRNYSIGIGQINRIHFRRLGWTADITQGFDVCQNISAALTVLQSCYDKALLAGYPAPRATGAYDAVHAALSCYYSGDLLAGARLGYVSKVLSARAAGAQRQTTRANPQPR